jgi:hypothetical protein
VSGCLSEMSSFFTYIGTISPNGLLLLVRGRAGEIGGYSLTVGDVHLGGIC